MGYEVPSIDPLYRQRQFNFKVSCQVKFTYGPFKRIPGLSGHLSPYVENISDITADLDGPLRQLKKLFDLLVEREHGVIRSDNDHPLRNIVQNNIKSFRGLSAVILIE